MDNYFPEVARPIEDMIVGEKGFTYAGSLIFDRGGNPYINVTSPFLPREYIENDIILWVKRTGEGYGEYQINASLVSRPYVAVDNPLINESERMYCIECALIGYNKSRDKYLDEFFPQRLVIKLRQEEAERRKFEQRVKQTSNCPKNKKVFRYNINLDIDTNPIKFKETSKERIRMLKEYNNGDYSRLFYYAIYFEEKGEPLEDKELDIIYRITDHQNRGRNLP